MLADGPYLMSPGNTVLWSSLLHCQCEICWQQAVKFCFALLWTPVHFVCQTGGMEPWFLLSKRQAICTVQNLLSNKICHFRAIQIISAAILHPLQNVLEL